MRKKLTTLASVVIFSTATMGVAAPSFAANNNQNQFHPTPMTQHLQKKHHHKYKHKNKRQWKLGLKRNKNLTVTDARTLTKAALLMRNRKDLQVGKISEFNKHKRSFYRIQIINNQNHVVSTVTMNRSTGRIRPVHKP